MSHYGDMMWINLDKKQYLERSSYIYVFVLFRYGGTNLPALRIAGAPSRFRGRSTQTLRTLRDQVGIPNRHLYTRDSGALWEACRENCIIFHACASARLPDSKIASLLREGSEGRKEGRRKMPSANDEGKKGGTGCKRGCCCAR